MADPKIPLSDLPPGQPGAYDKVAGVDTATGDARLFPMPQPGVPKAYETRASLPSASGLTAGTAAWVTNDPNPLLNGTWSVQGGVWVQSADRVTGLEGRVTQAESWVGTMIGGNITGPIIAGQGVSASTGSTVNSSTHSRTDFIRVTPGQRIVYRGVVGINGFGIAFYNEAQAFLSGLNMGSIAQNPYEFAVPAGVTYLRACSLTASGPVLETAVSDKNQRDIARIDGRLAAAIDDVATLDQGLSNLSDDVLPRVSEVESDAYAGGGVFVHGAVSNGVYPAVMSAKATATLRRFYAKALGSGSVTVSALLDGLIAHGPVTLQGGEEVNVGNLSIRVPQGSQLSFDVYAASGVTGVWAELSGVSQ